MIIVQTGYRKANRFNNSLNAVLQKFKHIDRISNAHSIDSVASKFSHFGPTLISIRFLIFLSLSTFKVEMSFKASEVKKITTYLTYKLYEIVCKLILCITEKIKII